MHISLLHSCKLERRVEKVTDYLDCRYDVQPYPCALQSRTPRDGRVHTQEPTEAEGCGCYRNVGRVHEVLEDRPVLTTIASHKFLHPNAHL